VRRRSSAPLSGGAAEASLAAPLSKASFATPPCFARASVCAAHLEREGEVAA
jgi:hypothetical protein